MLLIQKQISTGDFGEEKIGNAFDSKFSRRVEVHSESSPLVFSVFSLLFLVVVTTYCSVWSNPGGGPFRVPFPFGGDAPFQISTPVGTLTVILGSMALGSHFACQLLPIDLHALRL